MKKVLFLFAVVLLALGAGCKKKVESVAPPLPPPPPKISEAQFLLGLGERADVKNLKWGDSLIVAINPDEVLFLSGEFAVVKPFKSNYGYYELLALLKKLPLSVVWVGKEGSHLLVTNYLDFQDYYKPGEKFLVLDPKPAYSLKVGSKEAWVGSSGKFWKTW